MIQKIISFIVSHWSEIGVILLALHSALKGVRDAIDKTPDSADTAFEKFVTIMGKATAYFVTAKRPEMPPGRDK